MRFTAATLVFLSSLSSTAFGYLVTSPGTYQPWTNSGPQTVSWSKVSTDASHFNLWLTNQDRKLFPQDILLASNVAGSGASSTSIPAPKGGWPKPGKGYRINMVKSVTGGGANDAIYAQSNEFSIKSSSAGGAPAAAAAATPASTSKTAASTPKAAVAKTGRSNFKSRFD